jgi:hypothetical protein
MALERRARNRRGEVSLVLVLTVVVLFLALSFGTSGAGKIPQAPGAIEYQVRNYVDALEIESQKMVGDELVVRLRNVSGKTISAWSYSTGWVAEPAGRVDMGSATGYVAIAADAIQEIRLSRTALEHISMRTPQRIALINIIAVVFDDQTVEGDSNLTSELIERGRGSIAQLKRLHFLLQRALEAGDVGLNQKLSELERDISALPASAAPSESRAFAAGLVEIKHYAVASLQNYRKEMASNSITRHREILLEFLRETEETLEKYTPQKRPKPH